MSGSILYLWCLSERLKLCTVPNVQAALPDVQDRMLSELYFFTGKTGFKPSPEEQVRLGQMEKMTTEGRQMDRGGLECVSVGMGRGQ